MKNKNVCVAKKNKFLFKKKKLKIKTNLFINPVTKYSNFSCDEIFKINPIFSNNPNTSHTHSTREKKFFFIQLEKNPQLIFK